MGSDWAEASQALALLRGDAAARRRGVALVYARYGAVFLRYFRRHGLAAEAAEDVLQESFLKLLRGLDSWRGDGTFEAWLWTIARNCLMSHLRGAGATTSLDARDGDEVDVLEAAFAQRPSDPAQADCVRRAFERYAQAAPGCAEVIMRVVVDGWSYAEVAQFRSSSEGAAREYLSQCRKRLLDLVQPCLAALAA